MNIANYQGYNPDNQKIHLIFMIDMNATHVISNQIDQITMKLKDFLSKYAIK